MTEYTHDTIDRPDGTRLHVARLGGGAKSDRTLLFVHGWPEFWWTWAPVMERLAARGYDCVAPDLRGFGDSSKHPDGRSSEVDASVHAGDALAVIDALGLDKVGFVGHDVGAFVGQDLGRLAPDRLAGLFFFNCPHPGIGMRAATPDRLKEIWYLTFNQLPWAAALVGASRETIRIYFGAMLRHWAAGNPSAFDDATVERFVDNFAKPGNLQGGFNWYCSEAAERLRMMNGEVPTKPKIAVPTCVRWPDRDPILLAEWGDTLGETFSDLDFAPLAGLGHFPHREDPNRAASEIERFFKGRMPG